MRDLYATTREKPLPINDDAEQPKILRLHVGTDVDLTRCCWGIIHRTTLDVWSIYRLQHSNIT